MTAGTNNVPVVFLVGAAPTPSPSPSSSWELHALSDLNVESISLDYRESKRTDQYGNQFRYRARVKDTRGGSVGRWSWDVFFVAP